MNRILDVIGVIFELYKIHIFILIVLIVCTIVFVRKRSLMIKILVIIFILTITSIMLFIRWDSNIYETVRGLKIIVIDEATNKPLPNTIIYYCIDKGQLLPSLDTTSHTIVMEKYITDKKGMCTIPKHSYWKWPKIQWTQNDQIVINIEVIDKIKKEEGRDAKAFWLYFNIFEMANYEYYYNNNEKYRGEVILFSKNGYLNLEGKHMYKFKRFDLLYEDLKAKDDIIIVKLKQKI